MKTKVYVESLKTCVCSPYDLFGNQALSLVLKMSSKEDFKGVEAMTEKKTDFSAK